MNYELAKELKEAGFPQDWPSTKQTCLNVSYEDKLLLMPSLSQLIAACGYDFRDLVYHSKRTEESTYRRWTSKGGMRKLGKWTLRSGHSPEESVAKLWLALNTK